MKELEISKKLGRVWMARSPAKRIFRDRGQRGGWASRIPRQMQNLTRKPLSPAR
jgi:hypothetical protein